MGRKHLFLLMGLCICCTSCGLGIFENRCESDDIRIYDKSFSFRIFDRETETSLLHYSSPFHYDFTILDEQGEEVENYIEPTGAVQFLPLQRGDYDFQNQTIKKYYLYFGKANVDTLQIQYNLKEGKCDFHAYRDLKVFYNEELYVHFNGDYIPYVAFYTTIPK